MMKKETFVSVVLALSVIFTGYAIALSPCQSGSLTTSTNKNYQMIYTNEDFLQIDNTASLKDLEQLKDLTCLQYLDATSKGLEGDVAHLKKLANLEVLSLYSNPDVYGDICSLSGATKLRTLKFAFDPEVYGDISCLKGMNLETFAMTHTKISGDLSDLSHMTNLKALYITGTDVYGDISSLSQLTNLEELGISDEYPGNPRITGDLASLDNLKKLRRVSLYSTKATNCDHFTETHPNIEQGGCSTKSQSTLKNPNKPAERKIGKENYGEKPAENMPASIHAVKPGEKTASRNISLRKTAGENRGILETTAAQAEYSNELVVENSGLFMKTSAGKKQVNVLPEDAIGVSETPDKKAIIKIELKEELQKPVYSVIGAKKSKLLFIVPVSVEIETKIDAETGGVISVNKPWWSFLAW